MSAALDSSALDTLLPMHLRVARTGHIAHAGPSMLKLREDGLIGRRFLEVFDLRRPRAVSCMDELSAHAGTRLQVQFRDRPRTVLRGVLVPVGDTGELLVNLSLGISVVEAVRDYNLHSADFAPTDLTVEMLYLLEAKTAVMDESRRLNTRLQAARIAAEEQAFTDTLTGLKNRRAMEHVLGRYVAADRPFALMQLDLDFFKAVNDTLGHAAGDHVLQEVARILVDETRERDTLVRVGGDEFLLVLPNPASARNLEKLGQRLIARLEEPIPFNGDFCRISGSAGVTLSSWYVRPRVETMLADVDVALYASKKNGRGRVSLARPEGRRDGDAKEPDRRRAG